MRLIAGVLPKASATGSRTVFKLIFVTQHGISGMVDEVSEVYGSNIIDETEFKVDADGTYE